MLFFHLYFCITMDILHTSKILLKRGTTSNNGSDSIPTLADSVIFLLIFLFCLIAHLISSYHYHQWWFGVTWGLGLLFEILGYIARLWYHLNPESNSAFIMELVCVTVAPCFLMAGVYYIFAQLVLIYGEKYSLMKPMHYSLTFIVCDTFSFFLQAAGGGLASSESDAHNSMATGMDVLIAGLAIQVASMTIYQFLWYMFLFKVYKEKKQHNDINFAKEFEHVRARPYLQFYLFGISVSVIVIYIRSIYRLIEFIAGWNSKLATDNTYFIILEGVMVALATIIMATLSPGFVYGKNAHLYMDKGLKQKLLLKNSQVQLDIGSESRDETIRTIV